MSSISIAIDGPVASGKTTVGRLIAKKLGVLFVDTGLMYRAITWKALQKGIPLTDKEALGKLAWDSKLEFQFNRHKEAHLFLDGEDINDYLQQKEVVEAVSPVSTVSSVRKALVSAQREIASRYSVVMVGRDIGTVVLPDATCKIFLTASLEERAFRRYKELIDKGEPVTLEEIRNMVAYRDSIDSTRLDSPLVKAEDAYLIDSTNLSIEEVVDLILQIVQSKEKI